jgi:hypothetical protein
LEEQITKIFPRRLTSLQKSQIRRTLERTFIETSALTGTRNKNEPDLLF